MIFSSPAALEDSFVPTLDGFRVDRAIGLVWQAAARWMVASGALLILQSVVPLATLYLLKLIVENLTATSVVAEPDGNFDQLLLLIISAAGIAVIGNLCSAMLGYANTMQIHLVADHMQRMVQAKSIDLDLEYYENYRFYDKLHRAQRETPTRPLRIVQGLTELARNGLTLGGALAFLATFHWAVIAGVFATALPILYYRFRQADAAYTLHRDKTTSERWCHYFNQILTTAEYAKELRIFGFGSLFMTRFSTLRRTIHTSQERLAKRAARQQFLTESSAMLAGYACLTAIAYTALTRTITLGDMILYFGAFQIALGSLRPTLGGMAELYENNRFLASLYEFLALPKQVMEPLQPLPIPSPWRQGVEIKGLSFRYPGTDQWVLKNIALTIRPGEIVALVGCNGSGKSTLTKLLCRFYDPTVGKITLDGYDLWRFKTSEWQRQISLISQDFGRYHASAKENILLGSPELNPDDPAIVAAAHGVGLHDDLLHLPHGYDTVLSRTLSSGSELSVGQWQKLALARALVRDARLILLDEPTSALDAAAEFEFFSKFRALVRGRSALIISHRFSTVRLADHIYVLDQGSIIEAGSHDELVALGGLYADLYQKQASFYYDTLITSSAVDHSRPSALTQS